MSKTTIVKIETSARKDYFLQTTLKDGGNEGFQLMVTDGDNVWSGDCESIGLVLIIIIIIWLLVVRYKSTPLEGTLKAQ